MKTILQDASRLKKTFLFIAAKLRISSPNGDALSDMAKYWIFGVIKVNSEEYTHFRRSRK